MSYRQTSSLNLIAASLVALAIATSGLLAQEAAVPDLVLTSSNLSLQLRQGETSVRAVTLRNKGKADLRWTASLSGDPSWATLETQAGAVLPNAAQTFSVTLSTGQLAAGTYLSTLRISSNDPNAALIERLVTLKVLAAPVVVIEPSELQFDSTFVKGRRRGAVVITNQGGAPLSISNALVVDSNFILVEKLPLKVVPGDSREIAIEFRPQAEGEFRGQIAWLDNTVRRYSLIPVSGSAVYGPVVKVAPGSTVLAINPGVQRNQIFNLTNATKGRSTLEWQAEIAAPEKTPWVTLAAASGSVEPGDDHDQVVVNIDTSGVESGSYALAVLVRSNDPLKPLVRLPFTVRVAKASALSARPGNVNFPHAAVGRPENFGLLVTNTGNVTLVVSSVLSSGLELVHGFVEKKVLLPGETLNLPARLTPSHTGDFSGALTINTTDKKVSSVVVPVTASVTRPPVISVEPGSVTLNVGAGQLDSSRLTVVNSGEAALSWEAVLQNITQAPSAKTSLGDVLERMSSQAPTITSALSGPFGFSGGDTGSGITNGGSNMYNLGNKLGTNLAASIPYSESTVVSHAGMGPNGAYFTRKLAGLFVFAADMAGVTRFSVSGDLGANGGGTASGIVMSHTVAGTVYKGFFKRVYGAGVPSVNHLMITTDSATVTHAFNSDTNNDKHDLEGLYSASTRVYYLLFATQNGGMVSDAAAAEVMRRFLETYVHPISTDWVSINKTSGTVDGAASSDVTVSMDARALTSGTYMANLRFTSNAVVSGTVNVPITLRVGAAFVTSVSEVGEASAEIDEAAEATEDQGEPGGVDGDLNFMSSAWAQLPSNLASSFAGYVLSVHRAIRLEGYAARFVAGDPRSRLTIDVNGDGIGDVSSFASIETKAGDSMGSLIKVLTYLQRTGLEDGALVLEMSGDGGETWGPLQPEVDYGMKCSLFIRDGELEVVELSIPVTVEGDRTRFRLVPGGLGG